MVPDYYAPIYEVLKRKGWYQLSNGLWVNPSLKELEDKYHTLFDKFEFNVREACMFEYGYYRATEDIEKGSKK